MSPVAGPFDQTTPVRPARRGDRGPCPDCGAPMAADQRYCLACGHRRGDPRLPFMTAAGFIDSPGAFGGPTRTPPPPPRKRATRRGWNPNAVLVVGVAALLLAIGIGFLVGRALNGSASPGTRVNETITVENGGESQLTPGETRPEGRGPEGNVPPAGKQGSESPDGATPSKKPSASGKNPKSEEEELERKEREVLPFSGDGELAKPKAQVGESCKPGTTGCGENGVWEGEFFGH